MIPNEALLAKIKREKAERIAAIGDLQAQLLAITSISEEVSSLRSKLTDVKTQTTQLEVSLADSSARFSQEITVGVGDRIALTERVTSLEARVTSGETSSAAKIAEIETALATDSLALTRFERTATARLGRNEAAIEQEQVTRVTQFDALASRTTTLESTVTTLATSASVATLEGRITTVETTYATQTFAEAKKTEAISAAASYTDGQIGAVNATITTSYATKVYADGTAEARKTEAIASATSYTDGQIGTVNANITTNYATKTYADGSASAAQSAAISSSNSYTNGQIASLASVYATPAFVETKKSEAISAAAADAQGRVDIEASARAAADGAIHARWGVSIDVNGRVVGRIRLDGTNETSEFLVDAAKFTVWNGTTGVPPFQVVGGQVRVANLTLLNTDISGLGSLATANSVAYADLTGTKPPSNADVTLSAINGGLNVTGGGITLDAGGAIKGGASSFASGTGFFLGYEGGQYKFRVGNPSGARIEWDGSSWNVVNFASAPLRAFLSRTELFKSGGNVSLTTGSIYDAGDVNAVPSGGSGTYTYSWTRVSGSTAISATASTSRATKFTSSGTDVVNEAYFKCTVSDGVTSYDTDQIRVEFIHGTPP